MAIFLIRHGETDCNAARIVQTPEVPLSRRGLAQADRLAQRLAREGVARIVSSDLRRAVMTAERLQAATGAPLELEPRLQERNYGEVRGRSYAEIGTDILAPDYDPPGGEGWEAFHRRVDDVWTRLMTVAAGTAGNLAVVTHGLVCYSLAARHLHLDGGECVPGHWANASVTVVESRAPWAVRVMNCIAHLEAGAGGTPV